MSFSVVLKETKIKFSACHFLKDHPKCSRLHGHNYYVSVTISGSLNQNFFVVDFEELKKVVTSIVEPLDHYILILEESKDIVVKKYSSFVEIICSEKLYIFPISDICFLPIPATTSELLAKYIYWLLKSKYPNKLIMVMVGEIKCTMASYGDRV